MIKKVETNITEEMKLCFQALVSGKYGNFALFSCFVDGEPSAAVVQVTEEDGGNVDLKPLFVAITPGMAITDHEGNEPDFGEEINNEGLDREGE